MTAFDRWLEAPYVDAARKEAAYEQWCEANGLDPEGAHWEAFEDACAEAMPDLPDEAFDDESAWLARKEREDSGPHYPGCGC